MAMSWGYRFLTRPVLSSLLHFQSTCLMDLDGEPSGFVDRDTDASAIMTLCRAVTVPRCWSSHGLYSSDDDASLLIGCDDDVFLGVKHIAEKKTQPGTNGTGWRPEQEIHGAKSMRSSTSNKTTELRCEYTVVQEQEPTAEKGNSNLVISGKESTETRNGVICRSISPPLLFSESRQRYKLKSNTEDRLQNVIYFVQAVQTDHGVISSAISDSRDDKSVTRKEFHQNHNDTQSTLTRASQFQSTTALQQHPSTSPGHQQRKLFGLPDRITVSKREINMMTPSSF